MNVFVKSILYFLVTRSGIERVSDKSMCFCSKPFVCLFDLILYVPSTIFQLNRDGSSWVEPVLS